MRQSIIPLYCGAYLDCVCNLTLMISKGCMTKTCDHPEWEREYQRPFRWRRQRIYHRGGSWWGKVNINYDLSLEQGRLISNIEKNFIFWQVQKIRVISSFLGILWRIMLLECLLCVARHRFLFIFILVLFWVPYNFSLLGLTVSKDVFPSALKLTLLGLQRCISCFFMRRELFFLYTSRRYWLGRQL